MPGRLSTSTCRRFAKYDTDIRSERLGLFDNFPRRAAVDNVRLHTSLMNGGRRRGRRGVGFFAMENCQRVVKRQVWVQLVPVHDFGQTPKRQPVGHF